MSLCFVPVNLSPCSDLVHAVPRGNAHEPGQGDGLSPCGESAADVQVLRTPGRFQSSAQLLHMDMNKGEKGL